MKYLLRYAWVSVLGLVAVLPLAGCHDGNEGGVDTGQAGTVDPSTRRVMTPPTGRLPGPMKSKTEVGMSKGAVKK